jgi:hypothetical protein
MPRLWIVFIAVTVLSGAVSALIAARYPAVETFMVPPFWWPLFVALVLEIFMRPKIINGELPETPMGVRASAVIGGALLYQAIRFMMPAA